MAGWNGSQGGGVPQKPTAKAPSKMRGIVAGLAVVAIAAVCVVGFMGKGEKPVKKEVTEKPSVIKEVAPAKVPKPEKSDSRNTEQVEKSKEKEEYWLGKKVVRRTAVTNGTMVVMTMFTEDGKKHRYYHETAKPIFDNASDQILALATADNPYGNAPPLPSLGPGFENEFADSLKKEIVIKDDDSPDVKEAKARVKQARQDMLDAMGAGMSAQEVLSEHRKMQEENAAVRMEVVKGLREYLEKGDTDGAQIYVDKMNQALGQMGIMKIELPRPREEVIAERRERASANRTQKETKNE